MWAGRAVCLLTESFTAHLLLEDINRVFQRDHRRSSNGLHASYCKYHLSSLPLKTVFLLVCQASVTWSRTNCLRQAVEVSQSPPPTIDMPAHVQSISELEATYIAIHEHYKAPRL